MKRNQIIQIVANNKNSHQNYKNLYDAFILHGEEDTGQ